MTAMTTTGFRVCRAGRLRSLLMDGEDPVVLLGAGASVASGIPPADKTVERLARWAWCKNHGRHVDDPAIRRSDYWPWLTAHPWFQSGAPLADIYPQAVDNLLGVKSDRREFFECLINPPGIPPSRGYTALAQLLHGGWISTVLTTNFDNCLARAQVLSNRPHRLISISTVADYVMFSSAPHDPQIVFLHGSVRHYTDKNLSNETSALDPPLVSLLRPMLHDHPVIVVGYRGAEPSVMRDLFLGQADSGGFKHGVYWCVLETERESPHSGWITQLASSLRSNFQLVPIKGFDSLFDDDLLKCMLAAGALPTRRRSGHGAIGTPPDMRPLAGFSIDQLEKPLLRARLSQYAKRTDLWQHEDVSDAWIEDMIGRLDLAQLSDDSLTPTLAGWLLFSHNPAAQFPQARIEFEAIGAEPWLRSRFGDDIDLETAAGEEQRAVRRTITGNLWAQLDAMLDLLALVNFEFRLKAEVSRTVSAYSPLVLKETIVNAIVHRDYDADEPVRVVASAHAITVTSPGGLIDEVAVQVGQQSLQEAIATRVTPIKGYRNPAISDLFYGGGQMDRRGSGLSDIVLLTANNNGSVSFGPSPDNRHFTVRLEARPEAVDEVTNTAIPISGRTVRYTSNVIPIVELPTTVWSLGTTATSNRSFYGDAASRQLPPGHVHQGRFYSFYDLAGLRHEQATEFSARDVEALQFDALLDIPGGESIALKLLHEMLYEHLRTKGLQIDYSKRRAYFPRGKDPEVKITYQARIKRATRTVVKARTRRDSQEILYFEHKAVSFSVMRFGTDWAVVLTPGYAFTRDGVRTPISRDRSNALSTRRAARDFNPTVLHDLSFWIAVISGEAEGIFPLEFEPTNASAPFAPTVLLSHRPPTVSFNPLALLEGADSDIHAEDAFHTLEEELEALALASASDETEAHPAQRKDDGD
jgi:hypothetical protein